MAKVDDNHQRPHVTAMAAKPEKPALTPAAERALKEAEERRKAREGNAGGDAPEVGGRKGPDPARYGDWEKDGIASDF
jgi:hypothetical protein